MTSLEKIIDKAQTYWDDELRSPVMLPNPDKDRILHMNYVDLMVLCERYRKLGWCNGVFQTLAHISWDNKKNKK